MAAPCASVERGATTCVPRRDSTCVIPLFRYVFGETSKTQVWFFKFTGFVLWFLALLWIAPVGLLALALSACIPELRSQVAGLEKELEMV